MVKSKRAQARHARAASGASEDDRLERILYEENNIHWSSDTYRDGRKQRIRRGARSSDRM